MKISPQKADAETLHRCYAILSKNDAVPFPEHVTEQHFTVPFIDHLGNQKEAHGCLYLPASEHPVPLVYFSYYKMTRDSFELVRYLREGWAVASPWEETDHNTEITRDGLVANSALLYELRHRPEIDAEKIALIGGSAGGYTAMMLSALHLFACATSASGAFANVYFNFRHYAPYLSSFNQPVAMTLPEEERGDLMTLLSKLPIPYAIVFQTCRTPEIDERLDDLKTAAALTPSMLADCYSNPLMELHNTSDILVPVDQITRAYTYDYVSRDLPGNFKIRLKDYLLPKGFDKSFVEQLPEGAYTQRLIPLVPKGSVGELPFDEKPFQINIVDEGEPLSHGSHGSDIPKGNVSDLFYLRGKFEEGNGNNFLTDKKLRLLLERYAGLSIQLPPHEGDVYGSLAFYRKEVLEELSVYFDKHPTENPSQRLKKILLEEPGLVEATEECIRKLSENHI